MCWGCRSTWNIAVRVTNSSLLILILGTLVLYNLAPGLPSLRLSSLGKGPLFFPGAVSLHIPMRIACHRALFFQIQEVEGFSVLLPALQVSEGSQED